MFTLSGRTSELTCDIFPPFDVSEGEWEIGLVDLATYNSIPNIEKDVNDKFYYTLEDKQQEIVIEEGSYEITDIESYILKKIDKSVNFKLKANTKTLKVEISCNVPIDFTKDNTIASLLGFKSQILEPGTHSSDKPEGVSILKVNSILVECSIARGSYQNGRETHLIYEFFPLVDVGYKIVQVQSNILYLPLNVQRINNITVTLKDQDGNLVNFRNEVITVRLHVRKRNGFGI